jgi:hypothetical protein
MSGLEADRHILRITRQAKLRNVESFKFDLARNPHGSDLVYN